METILLKAFQLILSLSILVIVHEFGHFLFARIFKVRVEKFYLFFNPWFSLFKYKPRNSDTEYGIGWLPLGGYVKIAGMMDESMDKEQLAQPMQPWEFRAKSAPKRLLIMVAGVLFNFILAILIYSMIAFTWGDKYISLEKAPQGMQFSQKAHEIGFKDGDKLLTADGEALKTLDANTLRKIINAEIVTVNRYGDKENIFMPKDLMLELIGDSTPFVTYSLPAVVDSVMPHSGAEEARLQKGDRIVGVGIAIISSTKDLTRILGQHKSSIVTLSYQRGDTLLSHFAEVDSTGRIGVFLAPLADLIEIEEVKYSLLESIPQGINKGISTLSGYVGDMKYVFTKEGASSIGGFGTLGSIFPAVWNWEIFWSTTAFLSLVLAFMNILPIPALDGGHVLFLLYEVIVRRKPSDKFMEYAQYLGLILLFGLLLFANGNDVVRFFSK